MATKYYYDNEYFDTRKDAEEYIDDNISEEAYDEFLDEVYGDVNFGNLSYSASYVFKKIDPIAYNCGMSDWSSTLYDDIEEIEDDEED